MSYSHDMNDIEIEHNCYCADNGFFCPYLDRMSGFCIATTCKHALELLQQVELEKQAKARNDAESGYFELQNELLERAIWELENYGTTTINLNISEEDWNDVKRSWRNVRCSKEKNRGCDSEHPDIASDSGQRQK